MGSTTTTLDLADEKATAQLGEDIAAALKKGDLVALSGPLGAGKTTLARALIRALAVNPLMDVPSPTYTLVQTYQAAIPIAHFDFYRLTDPHEVDELDLDGALQDGIALVEWPENGAAAMPESAITITLAETGDGARSATIDFLPDAGDRVARSFLLRGFLTNAGWGDATRTPLAGDASTRSYETVALDGTVPRLIMNAPEQPDGPPVRDGKPYSRIAKLSESVVPFVAIGHGLRRNGFSAPEIYAADLENGFLLLEHLGSEGVVDQKSTPIRERYRAAAELLAFMHRVDWPVIMDAPQGARHEIPVYDRDAIMIEVELLLDWYVPEITGRQIEAGDRKAFQNAWDEVVLQLDDVEKSLVLRDFHSPNLIWREHLAGMDRLGLIDFQDALIGPSAYDMASLGQDARVTVSHELETHLLDHYCGVRARAGAFDEQKFRKAYAIMSVQRCSKILGIFVRLNRRDGKPAYLKHLPRVRDYLLRSIAHDALAPVCELYRRWGLIDETPA